MSELKAFNSSRIYWAVEQVERVAGDIDTLHLDDSQFYLKSEADKVISELEMKLAAAKLVLRLNEPKALYSNLDTMSRLNHKIDVVERRELHQKYKRCVAMAGWCEERYHYLTCLENWQLTDKEYQQVIGDYWDRWNKRWLELAEQFKEYDNGLG